MSQILRQRYFNNVELPNKSTKYRILCDVFTNKSSEYRLLAKETSVFQRKLGADRNWFFRCLRKMESREESEPKVRQK